MTQLVGITLNIVVFLSAFVVARNLLPRSRGIPRLLAGATLAWAWVTLGMQVLGVCWLLTIEGTAAWIGFGALIALAIEWAHRDKKRTALIIDREPTSRFEICATIAAIFLFWACVEMGSLSLFYPVKVMSDGPIYHLYFAIRWWKAGKLFLVAAPFGESAATYFPANGDLWFTWLMIHWGGDRLARVGQVPFLILSGMTVYQTIRSLGITRSSSLIATTWFLGSTALLVFSFEANVDTIFIAGYLLAVYFFLEFARGEPSDSLLWLGGIAAGAAIGTKSVGLVFLPPLIALLLVTIFLRPSSAQTKARKTAIVLVSPLILSGFWFLRNWFLTGNPLYPLHLVLLGRTVFPGWYGPDAMRHSQYFIPISNWRALVDILVGVLDPRLVPVWIGSLLGLWAIRNPMKNRSAAPWIWGFTLLAVANVILYWCFIPYRTQQRFMLQAVALAAIPLAQLLERGRWIRILGTILIVLHIISPQCWPIVPGPEDPIPWDLSPIIPNWLAPPLPIVSRIVGKSGSQDFYGSAATALIQLSVGALVAWAVFSWMRPWSNSRVKGWITRLLPTSLLVAGVYAAYSPHQANPLQLFYPPFRDFYVGWMNFDSACGPRGARVAYAGTNIPYYLFGVGLRNDVTYVNCQGAPDWQMHDFHRQPSENGPAVWPNSRPGWDRANPDYASWLRNLEMKRVNILFVTRVNPAEGAHNVADTENFPIERQWADTHPDRFRPIYGAREQDPWVRIYRFSGPTP